MLSTSQRAFVPSAFTLRGEPMTESSDRGALPAIERVLAADGFPPPSTTVQFECGAHSCRGQSRPVNEDHYLVMRLGRHHEAMLSSLPDHVLPRRFEEAGYAMLVADGIAANGDNEAASRVALVSLVLLVRHLGKWSLRIDDEIARELMDRAERFLRHVDGAMLERTLSDPASAMQAALTATFGSGRDLLFAHVGHSRAYLFRDDRLMRLTRDHTVAGDHPKGVPVTPFVDVNAAGVNLRHVLTSALGMSGSLGPRIDLERLQLSDRDVVLVCTNGLTDVVDDDRIARILASDGTPDDQARALVEQVAIAGGVDDATAVVARYRLPE
jgi:PPM family protein phosphatase